MIRIITDSASDIQLEEAKALGITVIPLEVQFENERYLDGVTLKNKEFYDKLLSCACLPKTSQINPYRFEEEYQKIKAANDEAIVITISSKLSGTYQSAILAKSDYNNIKVVDSLNVAIGERLLVIYAKKLIDENKTIDEIIKILNEKKAYIRVLAKLDTLKYLRKGGRISGFSAFAGEALNIKPIISIISGEVKLIGKGHGIHHANKVLTKFILEYGGIDEAMPFGTIYSGNDSSLLEDYIKSCNYLLETGKKINIYPLGCTVGTHIGPNGIGIAFFSKNK